MAWRRLICVGCLALLGCGTVGAPIAPDYIGVNLKREKERQAAARQAQGQPAPQPPPSALPPPEGAAPEQSEAPADMEKLPEDAISTRPSGDSMPRSR